MPDIPHVDYALHDAVYQRLRRQAGRPGWDSLEELSRGIALLDDALGWPGFPPAGDLLEIGCGAGNVAVHLAGKGWRVQGLDISPTAVEWARENARSEGVAARFEVGDVLTLEGVADASLDVVLDGHCLHCIIGSDRARVYSAVRRVLRPGGVFLLRSMCNEPARHMAAGGGFDTQTRCLVRDGVAHRYIGLAGDLLAELREAGFAMLRSRVVPAADDDDCDELVALAARG